MEPGVLLRAIDKPYHHYGVAVNNNQVVHLTGQAKINAIIKKTSFAEFSFGREVQMVPVQTPFTQEHIVVRAEYSVGRKPKGGYSFSERNCEHFARCVVTGKAESTQVRNFVIGALGLGVLIYCLVKK